MFIFLNFKNFLPRFTRYNSEYYVHLFPHAMCPNFYLCISSLSQYIHAYYLFGIWKNWCGEGCNFEIITFDYTYPFFKKTYFKYVSKMCSTKYDLNISDLLCPKPLIITGVTWLSSSLCQQTFRKIHYTKWSNYLHLKNEFVCFCM